MLVTPVDTDLPDEPAAEETRGAAVELPPSVPVRIWRGLTSTIEWLFGLFCLIVGLGLAASIPLVQFLSFGYLLEVSGRVSRSGRLRDGFFEIRTAARIGSLLLGTWLCLLPARFAAELSYSAQLFDPASRVAAAWRILAPALTWLIVGHIVLAWYCGGRLRYFLWPVIAPWFLFLRLVRTTISWAARSRIVRPILEKVSPRLLHDLTTVPSLTSWFPPAILRKEWRRGGIYGRARDAVWELLVSLRLPYYFWLGLRGFAGAIVWLCVPVLMIIGTTRMAEGAGGSAPVGIAALLGIAGSLLLAAVVAHLPFLQAHFAAEGRFLAVFELRRVRGLFRRAPLAFWFALLVTVLFSLPLYLLKLEMIPREVAWAPSLVFVTFIFPARLLTGWALGRARSHDSNRHFLARWLSRGAVVPVVLVYVIVVYFSQYTSWHGSWSLFEQHAFLLPVPFLSL